MRFLTNGLSGREPLLIDPTKAKDHAVLAEKFGFTDMLSQLFGVAPKPYVLDGIGVIPVVGVIGKGLSPLEKMMGAVDVNEVSEALDAFASDPASKRSPCKSPPLVAPSRASRNWPTRSATLRSRPSPTPTPRWPPPPIGLAPLPTASLPPLVHRGQHRRLHGHP
jgi:hypothetical protein